MNIDSACVLLKEIVIGKKLECTLRANPTGASLLVEYDEPRDGSLPGTIVEVIEMAHRRNAKVARGMGFVEFR